MSVESGTGTNGEQHLVDKPCSWGIKKCCEELTAGPKSDELDGLIWDLRGIIFFELKRLGKFDENDEGPDKQEYIDKVLGELTELI